MHVNLDHESMTKISLEGHNNLTMLNAKTSNICIRLFKIINYMTLVGLRQSKEELCKFFFQIKFPKYLNIKSEDHVIKPYHTHQLLR